VDVRGFLQWLWIADWENLYKLWCLRYVMGTSLQGCLFFFKEQKKLTIYWLWFCFSDVSYWKEDFVEDPS